MNKNLILRSSGYMLDLYRDKEYLAQLFKIALPIILQNFITSLLNMVGIIMIGQNGETAVAAVGLANQIFFLLMLLLFGINSGAAIFTAQFWGVRDIASIRKVLSLCLLLGLSGSLFFIFLAVAMPENILRIYSKDTAVVALSGEYLRIFGWSFFFTAITFSYAAVLRSTGDVRTPLFVSMSALSLNTVLSYGLIFGNFGMPEMGVTGAAIAVVTARIVEAAGMLFFTYRRNSPAAATLKDLFSIRLPFAKRVLHRILPVAVNEVIWSLGVTAYNVVYARIGTDSLAAVNIAASIDSMALVFFLGISHACAILVGNRIGAGDEDKAYHYAGRTLSMGIAGALLIGGLLVSSSGFILNFYKVSPEVILYARNLLVVIAANLWIRVSNMILFIGILRSGGDTRFAFLLDCGAIWLVGVPLAVIGAFVLHLPVYFVYLMIMAEELIKFFVAMSRYTSRRWINNLVFQSG